MTSVASSYPLSHKFRNIADNAVCIKLAHKLHIELDEAFPLNSTWRRVENLGMSNPPGLAIVNEDGTTTVIKWPTDEEIKIIKQHSSTLYFVELERGEYKYTYAIRTKS